jgi:hypothetical protein
MPSRPCRPMGTWTPTSSSRTRSWWISNSRRLYRLFFPWCPLSPRRVGYS